MNSQLKQIIDEQSAIRFTGRLNILENATKRLMGEILLLDGEPWGAKFGPYSGIKAIYYTFYFQPTTDLNFVVEPETIEHESKTISQTWDAVFQTLPEMRARHQESLSMRPALDLKLQAQPSIVSVETELSPSEFKVLATMTEWNRVKDIYAHCPLMDDEITNALVSLRKKGALIVVKSGESH